MCNVFMRIGITERGDPSIDFSWIEGIDEMDGTILITKNLTDRVISWVKPYLNKTIFHISCTGYGGTVLEPNIPKFKEQLKQAKKLLNMKVPSDRVVIRVDPIIPTKKGIERARTVIETAIPMGFNRFRISVIDMYPHVRERFTKANLALPYGDKFSAPAYMFEDVDNMVKQLKEQYPEISIESCAEGKLKETIQSGCVGKKDIELLGLSAENVDEEGYQRKGCMCCSAKTELLSKKSQCPYKCLYCYWKSAK